MSKPLYQLYQGVEGRDIYSQSFAKHMHAMTAEGLHSKADIAAELAYRDDRIRALEKALREIVECLGMGGSYDEIADCVGRAETALQRPDDQPKKRS